MTTTTVTATGAEALDRNGNGRAAQSGSLAPVAGGSFYQGAAGGAPIARRHVSSGPTGNGNGNGPVTVTDDDQGGGVALNRERNAGGWYVGPGRPGVDRTCDHCGKGYKARRSTSRFCSTSCRVAAWYEAHGDGLPAGGPEAQ